MPPIDPFERTLQKEWDRCKQDIQHVVNDVKSWTDEADLTFEVDVGVVKTTVEFKLTKESKRSKA